MPIKSYLGKTFGDRLDPPLVSKGLILTNFTLFHHFQDVNH